jgi:hypothetical protein
MMKPARIDWEYVLKGTLVPGISLTVAVVLLGFGYWFHDRQQSLYEMNTVNREVISEEYDELVYRRKLLERYYRRYSELQLLGFVGRENRLDWIATIRSAAKGLDLPNVTYSLEPQLQVIRPVQPASSSADIQVFLSRLEIEFGLVHELDLLRFFDRLELEAPGLMKVDRCNMMRQSKEDDALVAESNINANCSLMIFSVITSDIGGVEVES